MAALFQRYLPKNVLLSPAYLAKCWLQPARCAHVMTMARHTASTEALSEPPSEPSDGRVVYGCMRQVKTSPMKLNLVAKLIRGMRVTDAIAQMQFSPKKAARFVLTTLQDTQRRAAHTHSMDPVNLHVVQSYVGKGHYLRRIRYHGRGMHGIMHKYYAHYFLVLKEGAPPPNKRRAKEDHKKYLTKKLIEAGPRTIPNSL